MKTIYSIALCSLLLCVSSCKTNTEHDTSKGTDTTVVEEGSTTTKSAVHTAEMIITKHDGDTLGGFSLQPLKIYADGRTYTHKSKSNKHKFYTNGSLVYEVKFKEGGFKVRDADSKLLWKIKTYPDKIKISDNEENENPYEVKKYTDKIKIKRNDEEIATIQLEANTVIRNGEKSYQLSASHQDQYVYAVLAIEEIPEDQRLFILAELLKQQ